MQRNLQAGGTGNVNYDPSLPYGGFTNIGGPQNTDFRNTATYQFNEAAGIPLDRQLRWDPKKRKWITVGQWLRQSRKERRLAKQERRAAFLERKKLQKDAQRQRQDDYTLSNSFVSLSLSAG